MKFIHIKDGDYTCEQWFSKLDELSRPGSSGYSVTVVRSDNGFETILVDEKAVLMPDVLATHQHIADAYHYARCYLIKHPEDGFYIV